MSDIAIVEAPEADPLVPQRDIASYINNSIPPWLTVHKQFFFDFLDALLNGSDITPLLSALPSYYSQFIDSGLVPILLYDSKLSSYSHYDIRALIALSMVDDGPSFFTQFYANFYNRFEIYYADSLENIYEQLTSVLLTDEGNVTDELTYSDTGIGNGPYALLVKVVFYLSDRAAVAACWKDTFSLLSIMKPSRLFVFQIPTLDFHINSIDPSDPEYDSTLSSLYTVVMDTIPSKLATDVGWLTDGGGGVTTDFASLQTFLYTLTVITVKYADDPSTVVTLAGTVYIVEKSGSWYFAVEAKITKEIVYLALSGATEIFHAAVLVPLYVKALNADGAMTIRISWNVPKGSLGS